MVKYGVINPISKQTESSRNARNAIRNVLNVINNIYSQKFGDINRVLLTHYTGSKILFNSNRLYNFLSELKESHGDFGKSMIVIFVDSFYKERADLHRQIAKFGLDFKPVLTERMTLPSTEIEYAHIYMHMDVPILIIRESYEGIYEREGFGKRPQLALQKTEEGGEYVVNLLVNTYRDLPSKIIREMETVYPEIQFLTSTHTNGGRSGASCKILMNDIFSIPQASNPNQVLSINIAKHRLIKPLIKKDRMSARKDTYSIVYHTFADVPRGYAEINIMNRHRWPEKYTHYLTLSALRNMKYSDKGYGDLERDFAFSKVDLFERLIKDTTIKVKKGTTGEVKYTLTPRKPIVAVGNSRMRSQRVERIIQGTYGKGERGEVNEKLYRAIDNALSPLYLSDNLAKRLNKGLKTSEMPLHDIAYGIQIFALQDFMDVSRQKGDKLYDAINSIIQVPLEHWGLGGNHMQFTPFKLEQMRENEFEIIARIFLRPIELIKHLMIEIGNFYKKFNEIRPAQAELKEIRDSALRYEDPRFFRTQESVPFNDSTTTGKKAAEKANGYLPYYWRTLDFLFKALGLYWGKHGRFKDKEVKIEGI